MQQQYYLLYSAHSHIKNAVALVLKIDDTAIQDLRYKNCRNIIEMMT
jgi:hypothetical protein